MESNDFHLILDLMLDSLLHIGLYAVVKNVLCTRQVKVFACITLAAKCLPNA